MNKEKIKEFAEATVQAIFQSTVAVFYVDVQHDWFNCVRCSEKIQNPFPEDGVFSTTCKKFIGEVIPKSHQADCTLKLSCEYIRNHLNRENPEFSLKLPTSYHEGECWVRISVTLIDMLNSIPHHAVIAVRNITKDYMAEQQRNALISMLNTKVTQQDADIAQQNQELFLQNQELSALNQELLNSRDQLFELADDLQRSVFQNNMYREMLQLQQAGVVAYNCESLQLLYMNDAALSLYEMPPEEYTDKTLDVLRAKVQITDSTPAVREMPILRHTDTTAVINCSIFHDDGAVYYITITSKNIVLENGRNIVIDIINDVTENVLANKHLEINYCAVNTQLTSVMNALAHFADYIYHVDLTEGVLTDNFVCSSSLKPLEYENIEIPCSYDHFIRHATDFLGLEFIRYNGRKNVQWNSKTLLDDFYSGNATCEIEFWHKKTDTYHRIIGLIEEDAMTNHVVMTAIGNDITTQRKQEYESQKLLEEAQQAAENTAEMLKKERFELQAKHRSLETAFTELMEFNSIVQGLQAVFDSCYYLDAENNTFTEVKSNCQTQKYFKISQGIRASMEKYAEADIKAAHQADFLQFADMDTLFSRIKDKPYIVFEYECHSFGWVKSYLIPARYNQSYQPTHFLFLCKIIDEEKLRQDHLRKLAEVDGLTGISNRRTGEKRIANYLASHQAGTFGILDCDDFKGINDHCGHGTGDKVLITIANSLLEAFGRENVVFRLGGDEFSFYLVGCTSKAMLKAMTTKFFTILNAIYIPQLEERKISVSIGAVIYDGKASISFEEIYACADRHIYEGKSFPGNRLTC